MRLGTQGLLGPDLPKHNDSLFNDALPWFKDHLSRGYPISVAVTNMNFLRKFLSLSLYTYIYIYT